MIAAIASLVISIHIVRVDLHFQLRYTHYLQCLVLEIISFFVRFQSNLSSLGFLFIFIIQIALLKFRFLWCDWFKFVIELIVGLIGFVSNLKSLFSKF